ncbi:N-acetylneuraminate synthase family protein [Deferrisoma camini]|uniref:N-acetylneuraminate synthase family protein n=1 Tax=Deferrisoma camini TaxID=1035120 RepID=UPI0004B75036|nr:N-acetylneuraminate synthase family protein [Deferrisoma camini]
MIKPIIIAEVGCNHMGDIEIAKKMIKTAANFCEADAVKFQKRCVKELLTAQQYMAPHPVPHNSYGKTYGEHREFLEFNIDQHMELYETCLAEGIEYSCSAWELTSAKEIAGLKPKWIKIPSASNTDFRMLSWLIDNFDGQIHISLGMTTRKEEEFIVNLFDKAGRLKDVVLYACTSGYPVDFEDVCLLEIKRLKDTYGSSVHAIGFSGHHLGIAADVAGLAVGAEFFERHFTLNRTWKGTDHAASLEPDGLRRLARDLRNVSKALAYKREEILPVEWVQRRKLKTRELLDEAAAQAEPEAVNL